MIGDDTATAAAKALLEAKSEAARTVTTWVAILMTAFGAVGSVVGYFIIREIDGLKHDVRRLEEWRNQHNHVQHN